VTYFEKIGFVCPDYLNPAEFFFINVLHKENSDENEVPRNEIEENKKTLARTWRGFYKNNAPERTRRLGVRKSGATKCSVLKQFKILLKKDFIGLKRKKKDAAYSLFLTLCTAGSYFSTMRFIANTLAKKNMPPAILRNFRFFLSVMFIIVPVFMSEGKKACAELIEEKSLFCKEYNAGYYQVLPFVASKLVITAPLQVVSAFVFAAASQWFVVGEEQAALRFLSKTTAVFLTSMMGYVAGLVSAAPVERFFFGILIFFLMQSVFFSLSSFVWYSPFGIAFLAFTRANGHEKTSGEQFSGIIGGKAYAAVPERLYSVGVFAKYALMEAGLIAAMVAVCCCLLYFSAKRSKL
ncbi:MAG: ABC transporter superfamily protein, partial [Amphiamblys sp. WSBS2006]